MLRERRLAGVAILLGLLAPASARGQFAGEIGNDLTKPSGRVLIRPAGSMPLEFLPRTILPPVPSPPQPAVPDTAVPAAPPGPPRPAPAAEEPAKLPGLTIQGGSVSVNILILLTLLAFIPAILLSMTPFVRLLVVFHFLRQALGTQSLPTNQTLIGLSLFLTYFIMQPVGQAVYQQAIVPLQEGSMTAIEALHSGSEPARRFMLKYAREKDLGLFLELAQAPRPQSPDDVPMRVVVPAYILSELRAGFQIGVVLFLPFLVIDLVVASVTTSMGMLQLPPVVISMPLKLLLFVLVDGWNLVVGSLLKSFY
ncbi:MAG TPA: flagellar type III secretion system pore protein FliP [Terriglobia bacterium]|nr:flagellar type III secretion system pore protein FliP [Terriglobia bacterium]